MLALYAAEGSPKYENAALRWLARLAMENEDVTVLDLVAPRGRAPDRFRMNGEKLRELCRRVMPLHALRIHSSCPSSSSIG